MKGQSKRSLINSLNKELNKLSAQLTLQQWLDEASKIDPQLANALNGIYCGKEGTIHELIPDMLYPIYIKMGWYTVDQNPKVEYAYVS